MTAPEQKFDAELAWSIHSWNGSQQGTLTTEQIESLAGFLTDKGYHKGEKGLRASLAYLEEVGATLADEIIPVFESLMNRRDRK